MQKLPLAVIGSLLGSTLMLTACQPSEEALVIDGGIGGAPSGGAPSGGAPSGGAPSGGAPSGGAPSGGAPSGGAPSGGAPSGGAPSGGAPSGGAPSGGAPVGGAPSGGAPVPPVACADLPDSLYKTLGCKDGIEAATGAFVGKVLADNRINGYFLNQSVNTGRFVSCLNKFMVAAVDAGGTYSGVTYPGLGNDLVVDAEGCRNMVEAHRGMGVSQQDWNDLVEDLVTTLTELNVSDETISIIGGALEPLAAQTIEDRTDTATLYHQLGGKEAIMAVIDGLITNVANDPKLLSFFTDLSRIPRLKTCLVRQVCAVASGPCEFGGEVTNEWEPGVTTETQCQTDMQAVHLNMMNPDGDVITVADFLALGNALADSMGDLSVPAPQQEAVLGAIVATCPQIVTPAEAGMCP